MEQRRIITLDTHEIQTASRNGFLGMMVKAGSKAIDADLRKGSSEV